MKPSSRHDTAMTSEAFTIATVLCFVFSLLLAPAALSQVESPTDTPEMKRAPVPGGELEYEIRGDGEPVLLIHGALIAGSFLPVMDEPSLADYKW